MAVSSASDVDTVELGIAADKVCFIVVKARQFDVKEGNADPNSGSNPADDNFTDVLEDKPDDPVYRELTSFIRNLDLEEQINLVALAWLGRGTYEKRCPPRARSTTIARRNISSDFRCSAIISKKAFRNSAKVARMRAIRARR